MLCTSTFAVTTCFPAIIGPTVQAIQVWDNETDSSQVSAGPRMEFYVYEYLAETGAGCHL